MQKALGALTKRELVAKNRGGAYAIVEPFFAQWIVRNLDELPG